MDTSSIDLQQLSGSVALNEQLVADLLKRSIGVEARLNKAKQIRNGYDELNQKAGRRGVPVLTGDSPGASSELPLGLSLNWYADMLNDNTQLKTTLSKFQSAIDLIMAKHRSQTTQLVNRVNSLQAEADARVDAAAERSQYLEEELAAMKGKMEEMLQIMSLAVTVDNDKASSLEREMEQLRTENDGLREMLGIAGIAADGINDAPVLLDDKCDAS